MPPIRSAAGTRLLLPEPCLAAQRLDRLALFLPRLLFASLRTSNCPLRRGLIADMLMTIFVFPSARAHAPREATATGHSTTLEQTQQSLVPTYWWAYLIGRPASAPQGLAFMCSPTSTPLSLDLLPVVHVPAAARYLCRAFPRTLALLGPRPPAPVNNNAIDVSVRFTHRRLCGPLIPHLDPHHRHQSWTRRRW